jgi:hypothetical protein
MSKASPLKIDIFAHIMPEKFKDAFEELVPNHEQKFIINSVPTLWDMEHRFRIMDKYQVMQVLTLALPPIEAIPDVEKAIQLARLANDEIAGTKFKSSETYWT